jgi:hypothetical protein
VTFKLKCFLAEKKKRKITKTKEWTEEKEVTRLGGKGEG